MVSKQCGSDYLNNVKNALNIIFQNPNALIYLDISHWIINDSNKNSLNNILSILDPDRKLKGIVLNTSNYGKTNDMVSLCHTFMSFNNYNYKCIIDISRNFLGNNDNNEWCNAKNTGIGSIPTSNYPEDTIIDYLLWIKQPGISDGTCIGQSSNSLVGPDAGVFFDSFFISLWNNGYFVKTLNFPIILQNQGYSSNWPISVIPTSSPITTSIPSSTTNKINNITVSKQKYYNDINNLLLDNINNNMTNVILIMDKKFINKNLINYMIEKINDNNELLLFLINIDEL
jgi:cellulase/cellobiase CelA1